MTPPPKRGGRGRPTPQRGNPRAGRGELSRGRSGEQRGRSRPNGVDEIGGDQVEGRRSVLELLEANRRPVTKVFMAADLDSSEQLDRIEVLCQQRKINVDVVSRSRLEREAGTESHQGVVAKTKPLSSVPLDDLFAPEGRTQPFLLVCDGVTDPHNMGSLLRSAECAGVTGVVLPRHRSARVTPTVTKVATGAIEYLTFSMVPGIPTALDQLVKAGIEVVGLAGEAKQSLYELPLRDVPLAIVVGSEEKGLAQLSRKRCSRLASIPHLGSIESLNASVAGGVALFEAARQRAIR